MMLRTVPNVSDSGSKDAAWINDFLEQLSLTFGRLDGFTDHLLTLHRGGRVIPTKRNRPLSSDEILSNTEAFEIFSGKENCPEAAGGLDVSPYGSRHEGLSYTGSHQLNALSKEGTEPNTAIPLAPSEVSDGDCPWFQLGPRINQDARLHATFMTAENTSPNLDQPSAIGLSPVADGESGVFAWLLVNFHNRSIQVYDERCIFRGEAYLPSNPNPDQLVHWESLMMARDKHDTLLHMSLRERKHLSVSGLKKLAPVEHLMSLQDLIASMSKARFLSSLWKTIIAAQDHIDTVSTQQSATLPSVLVGRPIVLANLGLGIELATPPMRSQAYADYTEYDPVQYETGGDNNTHQDYEFECDSELTRYEFGIKLGDMLGDKDGLIGYLSSTESDSGGSAWTLVTNYSRRNDTSCIYLQHPSNAPPLTVSPSYPSLLPEATVVDHSLDIQTEARAYHDRKAEALLSSAVTVLIDPFLPVNIRSGICLL
ncbi:hypothetical protein FAGAP_10376 [Fusarium agapanthi]|uniref:Uncharacterized protein n=1 Tax=Fusarium agapanthi TaxID=1803897 RepID=A0A9P5B2Z3_9HYPO|nr:hypothetical protein FAGAP_10376 [Fusarium agapanthi]